MTDEHPQTGFAFILFLSAITGYISLSQEILLIRTISFATGSRPETFGYLLGFFLFGIAFGALIGKKACEKDVSHPAFIAVALYFSAIIFYFSLPLMGALYVHGAAFTKTFFYLCSGGVSFMSGGIFPVLCHHGIRSKYSGLSLSWIYLANIIGATIGPLVTGFILLNRYPLDQNFLALTLFTLLIAAVVGCVSSGNKTIKRIFLPGVILSIAALSFIHYGIYAHIIEKIYYKEEYALKKPFKYLSQNRSGILAVEEDKFYGDILYGDGAYDGRFNLDPVLNSNYIRRTYMIAAFHKNPKKVLAIGMGSGSWANVIANYSPVEKLVIVEINPDYLKLIEKYPTNASILKDPRVRVNIDDGRRWLNRHGEKFDLIVMNTTLNWRNQITNLLSREFLQICQKHLKSGGVLYYNSTHSPYVPYTASHVFNHVTIYGNFVAASDSPFSLSPPQIEENLLKFQENGKPVFLKNEASASIFSRMARSDISDKANIFRKVKGLRQITDDNMATEFKNPYQGIYDPRRSWFVLFKKIFG
jgi:spermidine synthase